MKREVMPSAESKTVAAGVASLWKKRDVELSSHGVGEKSGER